MQGLHFLPAAPEYKRIAAFQPHYALAFLSVFNQETVGFFLLDMVRTGAFAHADFHRIFAHHRQNFIRHQSIVKHRIRSLYRLQSMYGQQARIARPCAHQNHFAAKRRFSIQLRYQFALCRFDIVLSRKNTETAVEQLFPKITAAFDMMNSLFNLFSPFSGNTRHCARMQRNQCLNNLPPFTRQYRRSTAAGYGYLQRPPIHHGRHDKRT